MGKVLPTAGTAQGLTDTASGDHPVGLYDCAGDVEDRGDLPATNAEREACRAAYERDGLIAFSRGLAAEAADLREAVRALLDGSNGAFKEALLAGREARNGAPPDFTEGGKPAWIQYEKGATVGEPLEPGSAGRARKVMGFAAHSSAIRAGAVEHGGLADLVRTLLGGGDVEMFQDMALLKPERGGREKPWHQDAAYFSLGPEARVVGCWIALDAATRDNGCMVFQRGGQVRGDLPHFNKRDYQLCDADAPGGGNVLACPLPPGGLVLFDARTPHGTATNASPAPRNALQFHWVLKTTSRRVRADAPDEGRVARFGGDARGLTC